MDTITWNLIDEGVSKRMINLDENCENRLVRVECYPKDEKREGISVETVAVSPVLKRIDKEKLPMTQRHKLTKCLLDKNSIRVVTYNVLANCYSDTSLAKTDLYPYCPLEYLDFKYRKILLINEIKNYNADIIFLQECETEFLDGDLRLAMSDYTAKFKGKGERTKEGEAILFRSDRFKFVKSFDISISQELQTNPIFSRLWANISKDSERKEFIAGRGTILQVAQIESTEYPDHHFLLANTHLFFHPEADFIRLLQSIVSIKFIEKLKLDLLEKNPVIKKLGILFAGDFNSDPPSQAFQYILKKKIPIDLMKKNDKDFIYECDGDLAHSLNLEAYADFPFTNCIGTFEGILDYVFYDSDSFELTKVVPLPSVEKVKENTALPSVFIPSDHLALVFEFSIK
ncbi:2 -5 -phosphodiesterase 12 [Brachionus plicatilis]|uniref:2-5-phosphodiesterase 12 n=1 Tax=Brachionus plicatilis TaxID=10195 RepID=A0A3M7SS61_BRAPC|nr:2 -5 -phosphodiesterase 12 [Brachionus plicatilis]